MVTTQCGSAEQVRLKRAGKPYSTIFKQREAKLTQTSKPITPEEALKNKVNVIPSFVLEAFNTLLTQRFNGVGHVVIEQGELIKLAMDIGHKEKSLPDGCSAQTFFDEHWLDIETIYRDVGWKVIYDKPGFNESYEACWKFSKDKRAEELDRQLTQY